MQNYAEYVEQIAALTAAAAPRTSIKVEKG